MSNDIDELGIRCRLQKLNILFMNFIDIPFLPLTHFLGIVEIPIANKMDTADDKIEGILGEQFSDLFFQMWEIINLVFK